MTFQSVFQWQCSHTALIRIPATLGRVRGGRQAGKPDVWQHAKSSTAVHFPEDHKCPLSHPQSHGAVLPRGIRRLLLLTHPLHTVNTNWLWWMMSKSAGRSPFPCELFPLQIQKQKMWWKEKGDMWEGAAERRRAAGEKQHNVALKSTFENALWETYTNATWERNESKSPV